MKALLCLKVVRVEGRATYVVLEALDGQGRVVWSEPRSTVLCENEVAYIGVVETEGLTPQTKILNLESATALKPSFVPLVRSTAGETVGELLGGLLRTDDVFEPTRKVI